MSPSKRVIYYIGGSPCSGKSTVAQALSEKFGLLYFKVDDHLSRYLKMGASDGKECCRSVGRMTPDQNWMRDPLIQCGEELLIYQEIIDYILDDLENADGRGGIITEGAAYLPMLAKRYNIPSNRYISITPTKDFQIFHYTKRTWVPHILAGCSDQARAFENWMERDALFAKAIQQQCSELGYISLINDGNASEYDLIRRVAAHFGLVE